VIALLIVLAIAVAIAAIPGLRRTMTHALSGVASAHHRLLPAVKVTTSGAYAFEATIGGNPHRPVTYDPCQPITYTVNSDIAPAGSAGIIPSAIAEVSRLTGLKFVYTGLNHDAAPGTAAHPMAVTTNAMVDIAWRSSKDMARRGADAVGYGGSGRGTGPIGEPNTYVVGEIALKADAIGAHLTQPDGQAYGRAVLLHELGHVLGLAHVKDVHELMYPGVTALRDYGPGDREGLALLGQGTCN